MSAAIDDGGAAYPGTAGVSGYGNSIPVSLPEGGVAWAEFNQGMTLRDWFAGKSLDIASMLEHAYPTGSEGQPTYAGIATRAYRMADAMLAARKGDSL